MTPNWKQPYCCSVGEGLHKRHGTSCPRTPLSPEKEHHVDTCNKLGGHQGYYALGERDSIKK